MPAPLGSGAELPRTIPRSGPRPNAASGHRGAGPTSPRLRRRRTEVARLGLTGWTLWIRARQNERGARPRRRRTAAPRLIRWAAERRYSPRAGGARPDPRSPREALSLRLALPGSQLGAALVLAVKPGGASSRSAGRPRQGPRARADHSGSAGLRGPQNRRPLSDLRPGACRLVSAPLLRAAGAAWALLGTRRRSGRHRRGANARPAPCKRPLGGHRLGT
jgi:hypothetical protein